jgi:peptide/nickel transport system ATP-binding protein/oligopeptide transport system ATP-binding protein
MMGFNVREGETLGLVGRVRLRKTTVGCTMLRLTEPTAGEVLYEGTDIFKLRGNDLKRMRRNMQIIFQDPYASLDPRMPIGESISEGLKIHNIGSPKERFEIVIENLRKVGLEDYHARRYPHEFSGGQRQRIGIARALALRPKFIICDELSPHWTSRSIAGAQYHNDLQHEFGPDLSIYRPQPFRGRTHFSAWRSCTLEKWSRWPIGRLFETHCTHTPRRSCHRSNPRSSLETRAHHPAG